MKKAWQLAVEEAFDDRTLPMHAVESWSEGSRVYVVLCARTVPDEPIGAIERTAIAELRGRLKWLREELFGRQAI